MTEYLTHDLILNLGEELPEDLTLNMLRFRSRDTTLVVARSAVAKGKSLDKAIEEQLQILRNRTEMISITPTEVTRLGSGEQSVDAREMAIEFVAADKPNFQLQAACLIPGQQRLLVLNYSKPKPLNSGDIKHWRAIKQELRFT
ncbi:DcrB-related protein [Pseudomonas sp. FYR_11]|uniref:DcrB-related protein n=1 Tax=Pseudomonas TaxID=286 RepID=UPI00370BEA56